MSFKKNDSVRWKVGRATKFNRGTVERFYKKGAMVPGIADKKVKTTLAVGEFFKADTVLVQTDAGKRFVRLGYLKKA
jgi:hypothetical protein